MEQKIAFIGACNMASALINGLLADKYPANNIYASDKDITQREQLASAGIHTSEDNHYVIEQADVVILAVKPQILQSVCEEIKSIIQEKSPLIISIAAGINQSSLSQWLGSNTAIVRTMPNTPAMVQTGATGLYANSHVTEEQKNVAESILRAVGITQWLEEEKLIDVVTALSGSGPAYYFLFMEIMENTAIKMGLNKDTAHLLTLQTALGAAKMAFENPDNTAELRKKVTSPGGTTEAAINHLLEGDLPDLLSNAMKKAELRAIELSENMAK